MASPCTAIAASCTAALLLVVAQPTFAVLSWTHQTYPCGPTAYYDISGLLCRPCGEGEVKAADGLSCQCAAGYRLAYADAAADGTAAGSCSPCLGASSQDRLRCITCDATNGTSHRTARLVAGACVCASNDDNRGVIVETDSTGAFLTGDNADYLQRCVICASNAIPDPDNYACKACEFPKIASDSGLQCVCPDPLPSGVRCTSANTLDRIAASLRVSLSGNVYQARADLARSGGGTSAATLDNSAALQAHLESAAEGCHDDLDRTACNALANLCVLELYRENSNACNIFKELVRLRDNVQYRDGNLVPDPQWARSLPWLFYPQTTNSLFLDAKDIESRLRFRGGSLERNSVSELTFVLAAYKLSGEYLGLRVLTSQLQICGSQTDDASIWQRVGTDYINRCSVDVTALLRAAQAIEDGPHFYDIYYVDGLDGELPEAARTGPISDDALPGRPVLYPVPVIVHNIDGNDDPGADAEALTLTRRFFVVDADYGRRDGATDPEWIQYPQTAVLLVQMLEDNRERMKPPQLHITYTARSVNTAAEFDSEASFNVQYVNSRAARTAFWDAWEICMGVFLSFCGLIGVIDMTKWNDRRRGLHSDDSEFVVRGIATLSYCIGLGCFLVVFIMSWHTFLFFRFQEYSFMYIIRNNDLEKFEATVIAGAVLLGFAVLYMIYEQTHKYDLAMIDWEAPVQVISKGSVVEGDVSCWRSVFIANEWNELCAQRASVPYLTFLILILLLEGAGWKDAALMTPTNVDPSCDTVTISRLLSFATLSLTYVAIVVITLAVRFCLENVNIPIIGAFSNPLNDFTDHLYFANISLCIFDEAAAGFYLDGKYEDLASDTTLLDLMRNLDKQRRGQVRQDSQSAQMLFLGQNVVNDYLRKKTDLRDEQLRAMAEGSTDSRQGFTEQLLPLLQQLKSFLKDSESNTVVTPRNVWQYIWRDASIRESNGSQQGGIVRARDDWFLWCKCLMYGQELRLMAFEIMFFGAINIDLKDFVLSACITWLVMSVLTFLRLYFGRRQIAACTSVDVKFLV